jgi:hypothetical protein
VVDGLLDFGVIVDHYTTNADRFWNKLRHLRSKSKNWKDINKTKNLW